ncbi:MAG TPA: GNAT family N-acetyltransferase [Candidatus Hydrogenedentes bacterium]|nr:GNAT family N-acetyltransferase [Candidatus Hydrogenedentota bacterium]MDY0031072.1 GNAT family N-acetyltransferase [FCB group bacterium]NLT60683.1 GNAT family N-acetyltransferase [Candidatus Hydrogenedentota bacterium]HNV20465.1 GNAT family N-acetyltransferase [Candidatus Hydrogenedentota bacterium]HNZ18679.1 GNAT family N-acetyltransferase [Candidatus Hydrogenedentota bacterium]
MAVPAHTPAQAALVRPSAGLRALFLEAAYEYRDAGEELDPAFPAYWNASFEVYVQQLDDLAHGRHLPFAMVRSDTFWLLSGEGRLIGMSRLRRRLSRALRIEGGHIGYTIRPMERRKGYGTRLCALTIEEARKTGKFTRLLITCDTRNTGSARIIETNGGILENYVISPRSGRQVSRYWVTL